MESFVACALSSFGDQLGWREGINIERLFQETKFLINLLKNEYVCRTLINNLEDFQNLINIMVERNIVVQE